MAGVFLCLFSWCESFATNVALPLCASRIAQSILHRNQAVHYDRLQRLVRAGLRLCASMHTSYSKSVQDFVIGFAGVRAQLVQLCLT
jgi:hypothetical protein